jgi:hypothetical protein
LLKIPGFSDWTERALYRRRCAFGGQFLALDERLLRACTLPAEGWEIVRWDLGKGRIERLWKVPALKEDLHEVSGLTLPPALAGALLLPDGRVAVVVHGMEAKAPMRLIVLLPEGGVAASPLPGISPGDLVGFYYREGTFELVTLRGELHRIRLGQPSRVESVPGLPAEEGRTLELAWPNPEGWALVYSGPSDGEKPPRYPLFLVTGPEAEPRPLGKLLDRVPGVSNGERLDLSPGNVLPVHMGQWPTHRLENGRLAPLPAPPKALAGGLPRPSLLGSQVIKLRPLAQERLWQYSTTATGAPPDPGSAGRVIQRWRWIGWLGAGWLAGELVGTALGLETAPGGRAASVTLAKASPVMQALPAASGGFWVFDTSGTVLRLGPDLSWPSRPGLWARLGRIWRLEHLEPGALAFQGDRPVRPDRWTGLADRLALPLVLLGFPLLGPLGLVFERMRRKRNEAPRRPGRLLVQPRGAFLWAAALYLALSIPLLWRFWVVTAAL